MFNYIGRFLLQLLGKCALSEFGIHMKSTEGGQIPSFSPEEPFGQRATLCGIFNWDASGLIDAG
jgi:hypothetical protein